MVDFRMGRLQRLVGCLLGLLSSSWLVGQSSVTTVALDSVTVEAFRIPKRSDRLPFSVSQVRYTDTQDQRQQLTLADYLLDFPGVFALNANNYAQDLRIAIRGFGARSAFGIRGIKILVDGIPETTPDGQGQIDNLNLGALDRIELIRGGAASLYGNASGGVIAMHTLDSLSGNIFKPSVGLGQFGFRQAQWLASFQQSNTLVSTYVGHTQQQGYRDFSRFENLGMHLKIKQRLGLANRLTFLLNYAHSPEAQDPGGITAEAVGMNRRQARQRNIDFLAGETVRQFKTGMAWQVQQAAWTYQAHAFYTHRDFEGRLPFERGGWIALKRNYGGMGGSVQHTIQRNNYRNELRLGVESAWQEDHRRRFVNALGVQGAATLDQNEQFSNWGLSLLDDFQWRQWTLFGGLRYDRNRLAVEDQFLSNGDDSGQLSLPALNYNVGIHFRLNSQHGLFVNGSSSYETPVLSELSANPTGAGGFNTALQAQKAQTIESGYRWLRSRHALQFTFFWVQSSNEILPYELAAFPGRTFYRNAGQTVRSGWEASYQRRMGRFWKARAQYSFSDFTFLRYRLAETDFSGNQLPGLPRHQGNVQVFYQPLSGIRFRWVVHYRGRFYADDTNQTQEQSVGLVHWDAAWPLPFAPQGQLFFGVQNLTNAQYSDNIRLNAFGNRYFEPAPTRSFFGGVRWSL